MAGAVKDAVTGIGEKIKNGFTGFFDIHSPSRVMKNEVGKFIPAGIAEGITGNVKSVINAAKVMSQAIMPESMDMAVAYNMPTGNASLGNFKSESYVDSRDTVINFERMFEGANITVRKDSDITALARELFSMQKSATRGNGRR
ncbi:hypothetical protein [Niallia sp. MER 6]|uniref:hypothetical protein n=1 Tax=Niallia sp. MER 6 TaxID=2939567 RepID=UPI00203EDAA7|nr:hypothetical protein [Niallia sp. MER 6]MCM3032837.1 hypothetical protein [Niallia sp. MER 6]